MSKFITFLNPNHSNPVIPLKKERKTNCFLTKSHAIKKPELSYNIVGESSDVIMARLSSDEPFEMIDWGLPVSPLSSYLIGQNNTYPDVWIEFDKSKYNPGTYVLTPVVTSNDNVVFCDTYTFEGTLPDFSFNVTSSYDSVNLLYNLTIYTTRPYATSLVADIDGNSFSALTTDMTTSYINYQLNVTAFEIGNHTLNIKALSVGLEKDWSLSFVGVMPPPLTITVLNYSNTGTSVSFTVNNNRGSVAMLDVYVDGVVGTLINHNHMASYSVSFPRNTYDPVQHTIVARITDYSTNEYIESDPMTFIGTKPVALPINYGDTLQNVLDVNTPQSMFRNAKARLYKFDGVSGDRVTITMLGISSSFDTYLYLMNNAYSTLTSDDDSAGSNNSRISSYTLPYTGTYYIEAAAYGSGLGTFSLNLAVAYSRPQPVVTFVTSPSASQSSLANNTLTLTYVVRSTYPNDTNPLPISKITFTPGTNGTVRTSTDNGDGTYTYVVDYAVATSNFTITPTVKSVDSLNTVSDTISSTITVTVVTQGTLSPTMTIPTVTYSLTGTQGIPSIIQGKQLVINQSIYANYSPANYYVIADDNNQIG